MTLISEQKRIIERYQGERPVPVVRMAEALGVAVYRRTDWPDNISGRIFQAEEGIAGPSGYAIEVNAEHSINRRRFTIAHEIAHFVLHPNLIGNELYDDGLYRSGLSNRVEVQANRFAQRILMPDHLVQQALTEFGTNPKALAEAFQVSEAAMRIRLGLPPNY
jgi:hypothetical protein